MNITLYNFSKRKNSTKRPSGGRSVNAVLKENTSVDSPTFILKSNDFNINYVSAFGNYYWVTDVTSTANSLIEVSCKLDVLATYKEAITATSAYVVYDTSANPGIVDQRLAVETHPVISSASGTFRSDVTTGGSFIVTIIGTETADSYVIPVYNIPKLFPDVDSQYDNTIGGTEVFDAIKNGLKQLVTSGNLSENIRDIRWIPFNVSGDTNVYPLYIGRYETAIGGKRIDTRLSVKNEGYVSIPWQFSDWRNSAPYTEVYLYIPFVGMVSYPASNLAGVDGFRVKSSLDIISGELAMEVTAGGHIMGTYGASTGVSIMAGAAKVTGNSLLQGASQLASSIIKPTNLLAGTLSMLTPTTQSVGGIGNAAGAGLDLTLQCYTVCHRTSVTPSSVSAVMGTPTGTVKTLSTAGYIQALDASVNVACTDSERDEINSFLNNGFYLE